MRFELIGLRYFLETSALCALGFIFPSCQTPRVVKTPAIDPELEKAMDSFMEALVKKDAKGILAAFSKTIPWRQAAIEISELSKPVDQRRPPSMSKGIYYSDFAKDLLRKTRKPADWHSYFFGESQGEMTSRIGLLQFREWTYLGDGKFIAGKLATADAEGYMKWVKQDGRWYFVEYGEVIV